jgi:TM2 domain-containing membrane protein YozV
MAEGQAVEHAGAAYCLDCVGRALNGAAGGEQPQRRRVALAVVLSVVLPGLGQMYNRQLLKGVLVLGGFLVLAMGRGPIDGGLNTALLVALYFWNIFDAYWTAQAIDRSQAPDVEVAQWVAPESSSAPAWGVVLIVLGIVFLLYNFGAPWITFRLIWPMAAFALGLWLIIRSVVSRGTPPSADARSQEVDHE